MGRKNNWNMGLNPQNLLTQEMKESILYSDTERIEREEKNGKLLWKAFRKDCVHAADAS